MAKAIRPISILALLLCGMISACNLWGTNMKAMDFFEPDEVELLNAIQKRDEAKARKLLDQGARLNVYGDEGITPLFFLVMQKDKRALELALKLGADPNFKSKDGQHPIPTLAGGNDDALLALLLEHGGDPNAKDLDGKPAIFGAIGFERTSQIEMLLDHGADVNLTDGPNRNSAHYAAMLNKFELTYFLIEKGADPTNRNTAGGDIAWIIHEGLTENLLNPEFPAYEWAIKVKAQLQEKGINFPPPSPKEVRARWVEQEH